MKINDLKMATPIEEKIDQNLKVSLIDCDVLVGCLMSRHCLGCLLAGPHRNGDDKRRQKQARIGATTSDDGGHYASATRAGSRGHLTDSRDAQQSAQSTAARVERANGADNETKGGRSGAKHQGWRRAQIADSHIAHLQRPRSGSHRPIVCRRCHHKSEWRVYHRLQSRRCREHSAECGRYCGVDGEALSGGDAISTETM